MASGHQQVNRARHAVQDALPARRAFLVGSAWFFVAMSLFHIITALITLLPGGEGMSTLYAIEAHGETSRAWLMTYEGWGGVALALVQGALLVGAAVGTFAQSGRMRRSAHGVLLLWAGVWLLNVVRQLGLSFDVGTLIQAALVLYLGAATAYRARLGWKTPSHRPRRPAMNDADEALKVLADAAEDALAAVDILASDAVEELALDDADGVNASTHSARASCGVFCSAHPFRDGGRGLRECGARVQQWLREHGVIPQRRTSGSCSSDHHQQTTC
jgi:hypothetical protein